MKIEAKLVKHEVKGVVVIVKVNNHWKEFGTPYSLVLERAKPYADKQCAKRAMAKFAEDLGLELEWKNG